MKKPQRTSSSHYFALVKLQVFEKIQVSKGLSFVGTMQPLTTRHVKCAITGPSKFSSFLFSSLLFSSLLFTPAHHFLSLCEGPMSSGKRCLLDVVVGAEPDFYRLPMESYLIGTGDSDTGRCMRTNPKLSSHIRFGKG